MKNIVLLLLFFVSAGFAFGQNQTYLGPSITGFINYQIGNDNLNIPVKVAVLDNQGSTTVVTLVTKSELSVRDAIKYEIKRLQDKQYIEVSLVWKFDKGSGVYRYYIASHNVMTLSQ